MSNALKVGAGGATLAEGAALAMGIAGAAVTDATGVDADEAGGDSAPPHAPIPIAAAPKITTTTERIMTLFYTQNDMNRGKLRQITKLT